MTRRRFAGQITLALAVMLGGIVVFAALQRSLIYFPTRASEQDLLSEAAGQGLGPWRDDSGALIGWQAGEGHVGRRMLVFHGNAGYALHRSYFVDGFGEPDGGWRVYLFEYPGYGARAGSPSERDIKSAASRALQQLLDEDPHPVYLLGESLGSGVASYLAGEFPQQVAGLLLVTPFTSLVDVAAYHYAWLPVGSLMRDRYDSVAALSRYGGPVAFLLAGRDEIVPAQLGRQLYNGYTGPKLLRVEPGAGHNSLPLHAGAGWWREVSAFLLRPPATTSRDSRQ
jgi:pimeloyl-ACP methyl ester carboxylesterase